ncbi:MAG: thioredoxin domain-containing protein [Prochlorococcaceae cyanobacterium]
MSNSERAVGPGRRERLALLAIAGLLALLVVCLRGGLPSQAPLEALARRSPALGEALADGTPTVVEFYADWCESCRAMAPAMEAIEREQRGSLDVVLLNVDNPRWQPELERYAVNGIPHLELFDAAGTNLGHSIGARSASELEALTAALLGGEPLPELAGVGAVSRLDDGGSLAAPASTDPRSHG